MKFFHKTLTAAAIATSAAFMMVDAPAMAFTVNQNNDGTALLNALLGDTKGLSNITATTTGNAAAFGLFNNDPFGLKSGIALSTGKVENVPGENTKSFVGNDLSTSFGTPGDTVGSYDLAQLDISFDADSSVEKIFFQYVFGSEEFVEYANKGVNDSFELLINGVNLAKLSDGQTVNIDNLVPASRPYHSDYIDNPAGVGTKTKLDGYTKMLTFEGLLNKNAKNTLSIRIKDVGDSILDSAVFIKGGTLGTTQPPKDVPEPTAVLGLMAIGSLAALKRRKATVKA